jgi:hypothetical protein
MVAAAGASSLSLRGAGPVLKKARTKNCLSLFIRYVCEGKYMLFV